MQLKLNLSKDKITLSQLEQYLAKAAWILKGPVGASDFKAYIFPMLFFKRISDVYDEEYQLALEESRGDEEYASLPEFHRFEIPQGCHWQDVRETNVNVGLTLEKAFRGIEKANQQYLYGIFGDEGPQVGSTDCLQAKEKIRAKLEDLAKHKEKYSKHRERVKASEDGQVSSTDPESRALILHHKNVEVAYNLQTAIDSKYKLIVYCQATNRNDAKALYPTASAAKHVLGVCSLTVLADKGYHNGEQLRHCQQENILTLVGYRNFVERGQGPTPEYYLDKFSYSKQTDSYTCPQGQLLRSNGNWYRRSGSKGHHYTFKRYLTPACQNCPVKELCTKRTYGRNIDRTEYQDAVEENNHRIDTQKELYQQRQAICEHPFGTIKRSWGYSYTLLKGLKKVNGEMALICTIYNLRRSLTILGVDKLIALLKENTDNSLYA